ncbi:MAG: hypothetical protein IKJ45_00420 [Kiritimatiellae bacterium]|jgi:hypothetical protein|nr:hypothetical protein [Kiritimatiellia bacterium]MBR3821845.1 hypothetical protein [Kiritimatiellia bacterium]MBR3921552.1 hypothetical protein [Kiritimatiellia bacterium]
MSLKTIRSIVFAAVASLSIVSPAVEDEDDDYELDRWYVGASATLVMPQGGGDMRRLGGATARVGYYVTEALAVEADAAWLEDCAGLGVQGLWHIWGYERFDPFLTFGARGWIDGDLGPVAGLGAFYHLTDNWSLRADAQATLGIDSDCDMVYSLGAGVQYTF